MAEYKNIPVDIETHSGVELLCEFYEFGKRGKGAMVRKLVKDALKKLEEEKVPAVKKAARGEGPRKA